MSKKYVFESLRYQYHSMDNTCTQGTGIDAHFAGDGGGLTPVENINSQCLNLVQASEKDTLPQTRETLSAVSPALRNFI